MKIAHISIRNVLGIAQLEFSPEGFTEIAGPNGAGKTSVLSAIKAVLQTGHDATLLRKGAEKGEAVLVLDDGTELTKTITGDKSTLDVRREGRKVPRPAEAVKALTDMLSVNPVDFLRAPKKDRVRVLLEAMPIEADIGKLKEIAGIDVDVKPGTHALEAITAVHKAVYDARTGTNRAVAEKKSTINQLREAVPPLPKGVDGDEHEIEAQIAEAGRTREGHMAKIAAKLTGLQQDAQQKIADLQADAQRRIDEIRTETQAAVDAVKDGLAEQEQKAAAAREIRNNEHTAARAPLLEALAIIRADREAAGRRKQTLETITAMEIELGQLSGEAADQTAALAGIEAYKSELLASLPIPGVEVIDGEIYRDGVQFDRLNTAQQVWIAVELAKIRAAELGVVCVDGIELLDTASYEAFRDSALESGLQMFVTRVADEKFAINTHAAK